MRMDVFFSLAYRRAEVPWLVGTQEQLCAWDGFLHWRVGAQGWLGSHI